MGGNPLAGYFYRQAANGRPSKVLVSTHHPDPKAAAEAVLGALAAFWAEPKATP
jgi:hypothetical protein